VLSDTYSVCQTVSISSRLLTTSAGTLGETSSTSIALSSSWTAVPSRDQAVEARGDEPVTDAKPSLNLLSTLDLGGHPVESIGRSEAIGKAIPAGKNPMS
jgi:hypothetical protein